MDYHQAVEYLLSFTDLERGVQRSANPTMSLASMRSLLARLGDPHLGRPTVHITGSKGKGSTAAMVESILRHQGYTTALFTSPHLHSFTERLAFDGQPVSEAEFAAGVSAIQPAVEAERASSDGTVSTFGVLTALFFWFTRAHAVDWQVVEVGLGGTFDTTNVFESPDAVVITPISLEHTAILGNTCALIAADKSGLVKPGTVCVMAHQRDAEAADEIRQRCRDVGATLVDVAAGYAVTPGRQLPGGQSFRLRGPDRSGRDLRLALLGRHQLENAATAVATADALRARGHAISEHAVATGLANARIDGRLEVLRRDPLVVADGAHNRESAAELAASLRSYFTWRRCILVVGTMRDKDLDGIADALAPLAALAIGTPFESPRARPPEEVAEAFRRRGVPVQVARDPGAALAMALAEAASDDLICVLGSLYLVAEARAVVLGQPARPA